MTTERGDDATGCAVANCTDEPTHWADLTSQTTIPHIHAALCGNHTPSDVTSIVLNADLTSLDAAQCPPENHLARPEFL